MADLDTSASSKDHEGDTVREQHATECLARGGHGWERGPCHGVEVKELGCVEENLAIR